jgi:hypothetical protein
MDTVKSDMPSSVVDSTVATSVHKFVLSGILVVNVTWRGKTYVGTLMDSTKHDWAPPRSVTSRDSIVDSQFEDIGRCTFAGSHRYKSEALHFSM